MKLIVETVTDKASCQNRCNLLAMAGRRITNKDELQILLAGNNTDITVIQNKDIDLNNSSQVYVCNDTVYWFLLNKHLGKIMKFTKFYKVTEIDISELDTTGRTSLNDLFYSCENLTSITGLDKLELSDIKETRKTFLGCKNLQSIDLSAFKKIKRLLYAEYMFNGCFEIKELDLSGIDMSNVTTVLGMFNGCTKMEKLIMPYKIGADKNYFYNGKIFTQFGRKAAIGGKEVTIVVPDSEMFELVKRCTDIDVTYPVNREKLFITQDSSYYKNNSPLTPPCTN